MNPFFFGTSARQLFGAYEPAESGSGERGVVLCPPFGEEYSFAHPTLRLLSRQLAAAGYHVLRFDYYGTGDSAGEFEETDAEQWLRDISSAVMELRDVGQVSRVTLIGLRYGATLAARAAASRDDVEQLVLWDAISDGAAYLDEVGVRAASPDATVDGRGIVVTPRIRQDIESTRLEGFLIPLPRTLIISTMATAERQAQLASHLRDRGVDATLEHVPDEPAWREWKVGVGGMPVATVRRIVAWLS